MNTSAGDQVDGTVDACVQARRTSRTGNRGRSAFWRNDRGATAVEYAIMVSLIAVVIVSAVTLFGQNMIQLFAVPSSAL